MYTEQEGKKTSDKGNYIVNCVRLMKTEIIAKTPNPSSTIYHRQEMSDGLFWIRIVTFCEHLFLVLHFVVAVILF